MKITKNIISETKAKSLAPDYVQFINHHIFDEVLYAFGNLKKGKRVITFCDSQYVIAKVSSISHHDFRAIDGPIVRVSNGEASWRVDGDRYAFPI